MFLLDANSWTLVALLGGAVASGILCARSVRVLRALRPELAVQREFAARVRALRLGAAGVAALAWLAVLLGARATGGGGPFAPGQSHVARLALLGLDWSARLTWLGSMLATAAGYVVVLYGPALAYESRLRKLLMVMLATVVFALSTGAALHALLTSVRVE